MAAAAGVATKLWKLGSGTPGSPTPLVVLGHGVKFSKELWEPMVRLVEKKLSPHMSVDFLGFDLPGHGDSAVLRTSEPCQDWLPVCMEAAKTVLAKYEANYAERMVLGHSFGGASLMLLEAEQPGSFSKILVYEPVVIPDGTGDYHREHRHSFPLHAKAVQQRNGWSSAVEARSYFSSRRAFSTWHPDVLEQYLKYCLEENPTTGELTLKCDPKVEADYFISDITAFSRIASTTCNYAIAYGSLSRNLDSIYSGNGTPQVYQELATFLPGLGQAIECSGRGHLMVCEDPEMVADHCIKYLLGDGLESNEQARSHL